MLTSSVNTKSTFPFTPQCLTNCVVWLDAADTSSYNTSSFSTWRNKGYGSGGSTSGTSGTITSTTINTRPALFFGSNAYTICPSTTFTQTTRTVFTVTDAINANVSIISSPSTETIPSQVFIDNKKLTLAFYSAYVMITTQDIDTIVTSPTICCETNTNSTSPADATQGIYINGTTYALSTSATTSFATGTTTTQHIGYTGNSSFKFGEVLIFDGALTDTERRQVEGYLANKWGIASQLPVTHPYYSVSSAILYRPVTRAFQPVDISGCGLWLDGADKSSMTIGSGNITQWNDKSGNGYNATVAPTKTAGTYSDANNCVQFPQTTTGYVTSFPANPTSETMFVVATNSSPSANNNIIIGGQYGARSLGFGYSGSLVPDSSSACAYLNNERKWLATTLSGTYTSGSTAIVTGYVTSPSTTAISFNGGTFYTDATNPGFTAGTTTYLGVDTTTTAYYFVGLVKEIIFYNSVLTRAQTQIVEQYLAQKWNISSSMPTGHPGKSIRAFSASFTPKSVGTMALWLDAADSSTLTIASGSVTAWADKSGTAGYTASLFTGDAGTLTTSTTAGRTSVYSSYPRMRIQNFTWNNTFTHFIVARASLYIDTGLSELASGGDYTGQYYYISTANWSLYSINKTMYGADSRYIVTTPTYYQNPIPGVADTWVILCIGCNLGSTLSHYTLNGVSGLPYLSNTGSVSAGSNTGYLTINGLSYFSDGAKNMGEILHYNKSITVNERQQIEGYLAWKWGIQSSLPSTHPYIKSSP